MATAKELPNGSEQEEQRSYVFHCMGCSTIFGDSLACARMNKHFKSISLNAVTESVKISQECETSVEGEDKGSTYHILECKSCHRPIGRLYDTTPRKLDSIRDLYTLDLNKVRSYLLGKCTNTNTRPEIQDQNLMMHAMVLSLTERVNSLTERVNKLESLVVEEDIGSEEDDEDSRDLDARQEKKRKIR